MFIKINSSVSKGLGDLGTIEEIMINIDDIVCIKPYCKDYCLITCKTRGDLRAYHSFEKLTACLVSPQDDFTRS